MSKSLSYQVLKSAFLLMLLPCVSFFSLLASKGSGDDKQKKGVVLKVNGMEVKKVNLSPFSLVQQGGANYKGSFTATVPPHMPTTPNAPVVQPHSLITYQKGNTIFIYPVKQPTMMQKFKTPTPH